MIFDLLRDFATLLDSMPNENPHRRILSLLEAAVLRDVYFVNRHSTTLFQSLWNSCWWQDCPELTNHLTRSLSESMCWRISRRWHKLFGWLNIEPEPPKLHTLLENWRRQKEQRTPGFLWLRSLRPPATSLDCRVNSLPGHCRCFKLLDVSPDGTRVVAASDEYWIGVWSGGTGIMMATLFLHIRGVNDVKFAPDGTWLGGLSYYGRAMIAWDTASLREIPKPEVALSKLLFDNSRRPARYGLRPDGIGTMILNDTGVALACLRARENWCSDISGRLWAASNDSNIEVFRLEGDL